MDCNIFYLLATNNVDKTILQMPLSESMLSTLKSNKNIMLDKSRRFRKTKGGYKWSNNQLPNLPKVSENELVEIRKRIQKENICSNVKQWSFFSIILLTFALLLFYLIKY
ncbi:hypothetical protein E1J38_004950 [Seonamhaeicola sediminis]|uniref:Uncharacterized protein n=1 Tax=Seonamhaeicola sediminis TaxID=2528206 RepID=A0A562YF72_9FLAO|nr:hypothetical protein [Seonamhaeicola sediminis]TWO33248.1 hypothetical protein E1J38_004950 [Seonamhaeicola sediminis]